MALTVLTNSQARSVLDNLTQDQLYGFQAALSRALYEYSTDPKAVEDGTYYQPPRIHHTNPRNGATTLFMPSVGPSGMGVKVVTLSTPAKDGEQGGAALPVIKPTGAVTVFAPDGSPRGFLHASALTAFRTALASSCLVRLRSTVEDIVVFGAGKQAYWHLRQALLLKGPTVRRITAINRSKKNAEEMLASLAQVSPELRLREGWQSTTMDAMSPNDEGYEGRLAERLRESDVIMCCTPSTEDLFSADILVSEEGRKKTRLITAVGSYAPHMRELPQKLLLQAFAPNHDPSVDGGTIVADTIEGALTEAGEFIQGGIQPAQLTELGGILTLHDPASPTAGGETTARWLRDGNVIFKSVGLGLMDLVISTHLIDVAEELKLGTQIEGFEL